MKTKITILYIGAMKKWTRAPTYKEQNWAKKSKMGPSWGVLSKSKFRS